MFAGDWEILGFGDKLSRECSEKPCGCFCFATRKDLNIVIDSALDVSMESYL